MNGEWEVAFNRFFDRDSFWIEIESYNKEIDIQLWGRSCYGYKTKKLARAAFRRFARKYPQMFKKWRFV